MEKSHKEFFEKLKALLTEFDASVNFFVYDCCPRSEALLTISLGADEVARLDKYESLTADTITTAIEK